MKLLKRELLAWKKREVLWVLLAVVIVMSYLGYLDYVYYENWMQQKWYIEEIWKLLLESEAEKELALDLLWKTVVAFSARGNIMNTVIAALLVCMSYGRDIYAGRIRGMQREGMKLYQIHGYAFFVTYVLSLLLVFLGALIPLLRLNALWWGRVHVEDLTFLARPVIELCLETFVFVASAMLCCSLAARTHPVIPFFLFMLLLLLIKRVIGRIASGLAYEAGSVGDQYEFFAYYLYDIDQHGLGDMSLAPRVDNPLERKAWGELTLLGYLISGMICSVVSWIVFHFHYKRK